ncbi:MAG TPA: sigma-70 family RNA polymerase sigma factor [Candidatus Dormibacteraeota bacterium]|nr:sigma-70 family RNA polymerase sigma factor [Candidatus Dormibacteraeota bacterium]
MQRVADIETPRSSSIPSDRAFADILRPLIDPGFRLALAMLRDRGAAEDAVQEASFTAWRKLATMRDRGRVRPWFLGIVANKCRNARRGKWFASVSLGVPEDVAIVSNEDESLRRSDLRAAVARLPHDDQLVIVLFFYLDLPLEEVASVVGLSVAATRGRLYRSVNKLRPGVDIEEAIR